MASAVVPFAKPLPLAERSVDPLAALPDWAREEAGRRLKLIQPGLDRMANNVSVRTVAEWLASIDPTLPSAPTFARWIRDFQTKGLIGLAPQHKGRVRKEHGWEARALELFNQPTKPMYSTVAGWLRDEGHAGATNHLVRRFLQAMPSNLTETGKKRLGAHFYKQNIAPYVIRDTSEVPVGFIYEGDGHCVDVYVAHPATGKPFRPELTPWGDIRSQKITGWWLSESESAHTTLFSLSRALLQHDHVPAFVHSDPGSGFIARMISDDDIGFLARFRITPIRALAGNAKGKGFIEGWFRWFEERCGKRFPTYCGKDRSDDFLRRLQTKINRGEVVLPTLAQFRDAVAEYIERYNNAPKPSLGGLSPNQVWEGLQRVPLEIPAEAVLRPREKRTVQRWSVRLDNRIYRAGDLSQFETREVIVEYDLHDDSRVWIHDEKGRFVCEAELVQKKAWLPASRIEEGQQKRLEGQLERLQVHVNEKRLRSHTSLTASLDARTSQILEQLDAEPMALPAPPALAIQDELSDAQRRYARAVAIEQAQAQGDLVDESDAEWLSRYSTSAEYRSEQQLAQHFNPGL